MARNTISSAGNRNAISRRYAITTRTGNPRAMTAERRQRIEKAWQNASEQTGAFRSSATDAKEKR